MKKLSLQWRITVLTALVLFVCTVTLTAIAISNAEKSFMGLISLEPAVNTMDSSAMDPLGQLSADVTTPAQVMTTAQVAKRQFDMNSILFCVLFTVLGTTAVYFVTGSALRPLRRLSEKVDGIDEHTLSVRLPEAFSRDEVGKLTVGFNQMLIRLDDAFLRQKQFTANAAHELKTPLAILKTGAQVLVSDKSAKLPDYQENVQITLSNVDRLSKIVDDLLLLASAGEAAKEDREDVLLEPLFDAICSELSPMIAMQQISCHVECGDLTVYGNPPFLYRAFFNLIENACKYGKKSGNIWVQALQDTEGVAVSVRDDGPGISSEHQPYLFDAFYRIDKSRSREVGGSGLGLSIVKTMIEACGGAITVNSDGKSGTEFTVIFPESNGRNEFPNTL